jgi:hypothetical protein
MSRNEVEEAERQQEKVAAQSCANQVAERYSGTRCIGTCIQSKIPHTLQFFFDEHALKLCHDKSKSKGKLLDCPGYNYYLFLREQFEKYYIRYDNGVEAIRSEDGIERIPPPVPDYSTKNESGIWHYHTPENLPDKYKHDREVDDFCPRAQLKKLVSDIGPPDMVTEMKSDGTVEIKDGNNTYQKIQGQLPEFIDKYTGQDLKLVVQKEADTITLRMLKKEKTHTEAHTSLATSTSFSVHKKEKEPLKLTIKRCALPAPLPWNGWHLETEFVNSCTIDNMLYFFHLLQTESEQIREGLKDSVDPVERLLYEIHTLFNHKRWAEGNYL